MSSTSPLITHHSSLITAPTALITAAVVARDEAAFLGGCLRSLAWADRVLVLVDDRSSDATAAIARRFTSHVHLVTFESFPQIRNHALALAVTPWVLFVDADERVPAALAAEVRAAVARAAHDGTVGYWLPRRNRILGRWMRGTGWWPDYQLRLLRQDTARYDPGALVHEVAALDGPAGRLQTPLLHSNYATLDEFLSKQRRYAALEAHTRWQAGEAPPRSRALIGQPLREFWRRYVLLRGWRDGALGLLLSVLMGHAAWQRTRLLARLWDERGAPSPARAARGRPLPEGEAVTGTLRA